MSGAHVFALTGGIGSGKSTVAEIWRETGLPVVNADYLARAVVAPGTPGLIALTAMFGQEILAEDGSLDRKALGARVFKDESDRQVLEGILHPLIARAAQAEFQRLGDEGQPIVCYEVPLLFETDQAERYRPVVVVSVPEPAQVARTMSRDGLDEDGALARVRAQFPLHEKASRADFVIDNSGTREETKTQALKILDRLRASLSSAQPG